MVRGMGLTAGLSAMRAFSLGVQGTAYNVANVSTNGFQPVAVHYQSGRPADIGVQPVVTRPGPLPEDGLNFSRTDLAREMTQLIVNQRSFEANAATIRTTYDML